MKTGLSAWSADRVALFAMPILLFLTCLFWADGFSPLPFAATVLILLFLLIATPRLPRTIFLFYTVLCVASAALSNGLMLLRGPADAGWILSSVLAVVTLTVGAVFLTFHNSRILYRNGLEVLANTVPVLLWTANGETGGVDWINRNWRELGWSYEDLAGDRWGAMMHPEDLPRLRARWQASVETGAYYEEMMRVRRAWGEYRWMVIRASPDMDEDGDVIRWYGVANDIDDLKKAEERLERMRGDLARVSRVNTMGELTAAIAHDINQPLAASVTNAQVALRWLAADPPNLAEAIEAVEDAVAGAKRASDVVERLRGLYQKTDLKPSVVNIGPVVADSIALVAPTARAANVTLTVREDGAIGPVMGDEIHLQQVFINLVVNGIDAIKAAGHAEGDITIRTAATTDGGVRVDVEDSGPGISDADEHRLFEAFYSTKDGGMGMGLAICRTIIERLEGRLSVCNAPSGGGLFTITLPPANGGNAPVPV